MSKRIGDRLWEIWYGMRQRCRGTTSESTYWQYAGRGIQVCSEWEDYNVFKEWALAHGYADHLTLERKNNDGDYEPGNCRWATAKEQARNRTNTTWVEFNGETKSLAEWCELLGLKYSTIRLRLRAGYTPEQAFVSGRIKRKSQN